MNVKIVVMEMIVNVFVKTVERKKVIVIVICAIFAMFMIAK
jgi:hypothetical protein